MATAIPTKKQAPAHLLEHTHITPWLACAEPDLERDRLAEVYISATAQYQATMRRESELVAELKAVAREIAGDPGSNLDKLIKHQSRLTAELAMLPDLRVEATEAYIRASDGLGGYLARVLTREYNDLTDVINAGIKEQLPLMRIIETRPEPPGHDEAVRKRQEIGARLKPHVERRATVERALTIARMLPIEQGEAARMIRAARER